MAIVTRTLGKCTICNGPLTPAQASWYKGNNNVYMHRGCVERVANTLAIHVRGLVLKKIFQQ